MFPGETLLTGAKPSCEDCGHTFRMQVLVSGAGYYIGSKCDCEPNSRESSYYASREEALADLPAFTKALEERALKGAVQSWPRNARRP